MQISSTTEGADWYVARLSPGCTQRAILDLSRKNIKHLNPVARVEGELIPLLPGYLLVELSSQEDFYEVNSAKGINRLLPLHSENPLAIPKKVFSEFQSRINSGHFDVQSDEEYEKMPRFKKGEQLFVVSGPFAGHLGNFERVKKGLVCLSLVMLGQTVSVWLKGHQVQKKS